MFSKAVFHVNCNKQKPDNLWKLRVLASLKKWKYKGFEEHLILVKTVELLYRASIRSLGRD